MIRMELDMLGKRLRVSPDALAVVSANLDGIGKRDRTNCAHRAVFLKLQGKWETRLEQCDVHGLIRTIAHALVDGAGDVSLELRLGESITRASLTRQP